MTIFGLITVVAGLVSTLLGGVIADRLRSRLPWFLLLGLGIGMLIACPIFHCDPLHSVSSGVDHDVPGNLFPVSKHRSFKHGSRQRFAACGARDGVCRKHLSSSTRSVTCRRSGSSDISAGHANMHVAFLFVVRNHSRSPAWPG